uniref:ADNP homeobox 2b n=1 Tax=Tetraodon nigroviridis TaxID=99883 RepID=H3CUV0_TETNG
MYQLPVGNIEKIRKARKAVKNILSEIGLEDCQNLRKDLRKNSEKTSDENEAFVETDWYDFTHGYGGRLHKKWPYRSQALCCSVCKYSSQSIHNFRNHVSRCHADMHTLCSLASCSQCIFIGHPRVVKKHVLFFHSSPAVRRECYKCQKCAFASSSIFNMKKHVILKHLEHLAEQYIGYRLNEQGKSATKVYCCKVCRVNIGTLDQMLHHMLLSKWPKDTYARTHTLMHISQTHTYKSTVLAYLPQSSLLPHPPNPTEGNASPPPRPRFQVVLMPCAAASASTPPRASTTSGTTSPVAMPTCTPCARWRPAPSASSSATPGSSRNTSSSSTVPPPWYIGYRLNEQGKSATKVYCCKVCRVNIGTLDQMLHHMLVEPSHYSVSTQVQGLICENKNFTVKPVANGSSLFVTFPSIAPKAQPPQIFSGKSLVLPSNGQAAGTVLALQQVSGGANSATLICTPATNQAFLPPQASALVQLASAEAKGLLRPGATIALQSALTHGPSVVQLPAVSNVTIKQAAVTPAPAQPQQKPQNVLLPSAAQAAAAPKAGVVVNNALSLKGTMLTSQSLLSHLIPTGNRVNGLPTYTFAPLQVAVPTSQSSPVKPAEQIAPGSPQTKKWITCPFCNELFPSNFDMHAEVAHQTKSKASSSENVAAQAAFLKRMPDKTMKCLTCKVLVPEKGIFQHLLHGLSCLHCSALFFSVKQLVEHVKQHNPSSKAYRDFLRQKYKIHSKNAGGILFPRIDFQTSAPKEILGEAEVNLALVTSSLELSYFKLQALVQPEVCAAAAKMDTSFCPFCDEKFQSESAHTQHLRQKHFVAPTVHAILKTDAFKCIYCNGVYTGKVTQQAVMLHIQRCRCSPK